MKKNYFLFSFLLGLVFFQYANATVWKVGSSRTYKMPSAVAGLVGNGDTVDIDAGTYTGDVAYWAANNLLLRGVGGFAHLDANNTSYGRKAIWVINGTNTTVQYIEFSNCHDVAGLDMNWAGIRQQGANLNVSHCYFHDNDDGILAGAVNPSKILIEYSEFGYNGYGDGYSHNLYINAVDTLIFRYNYSHHAKIGHELKSRAWVNYILYNRFSNEATGTASRDIDLPQGGTAIVMGNIIHQGANTSNSNVIGYKLEAPVNPTPHNFYLINNTIVSERSSAVFVSVGAGTNIYKGYNNIFAGPGSLLSGTPATLDTASNKFFTTISSAGFVNSATYDYHLTASSKAINAGINAGSASNSYVLNPIYEYVHPANRISRTIVGSIDAGGYEYIAPTGITNMNKGNISISLAYDVLTLSSSDKISMLNIYDITGKLIFSQEKNNSESCVIDVSSFVKGVYIIQAITEKGEIINKKVKF